MQYIHCALLRGTHGFRKSVPIGSIRRAHPHLQCLQCLMLDDDEEKRKIVVKMHRTG